MPRSVGQLCYQSLHNRLMKTGRGDTDRLQTGLVAWTPTCPGLLHSYWLLSVQLVRNRPQRWAPGLVQRDWQLLERLFDWMTPLPSGPGRVRPHGHGYLFSIWICLSFPWSLYRFSSSWRLTLATVWKTACTEQGWGEETTVGAVSVGRSRGDKKRQRCG